MNFFAFSAPGYCGPGASSELNILIELEQKYCKFNFFFLDNKKNYAVVTSTSGWGFCTKDCQGLFNSGHNRSSWKHSLGGFLLNLLHSLDVFLCNVKWNEGLSEEVYNQGQRNQWASSLQIVDQSVLNGDDCNKLCKFNYRGCGEL